MTSNISVNESLEALARFATLPHEKEAPNRGLIVVRKHDNGEIYFEAVEKSKLGWWDRLCLWLHTNRFSLKKIAEIANAILNTSKEDSWAKVRSNTAYLAPNISRSLLFLKGKIFESKRDDKIPIDESILSKLKEILSPRTSSPSPQEILRSTSTSATQLLNDLSMPPRSTTSNIVGLENPGVLCFFNGTVSALAAVPIFRTRINDRIALLEAKRQELEGMTSLSEEERKKYIESLLSIHKKELKAESTINDLKRCFEEELTLLRLSKATFDALREPVKKSLRYNEEPLLGLKQQIERLLEKDFRQRMAEWQRNNPTGALSEAPARAPSPRQPRPSDIRFDNIDQHDAGELLLYYLQMLFQDSQIIVTPEVAFRLKTGESLPPNTRITVLSKKESEAYSVLSFSLPATPPTAPLSVQDFFRPQSLQETISTRNIEIDGMTPEEEEKKGTRRAVNDRLLILDKFETQAPRAAGSEEVTIPITESRTLLGTPPAFLPIQINRFVDPSTRNNLPIHFPIRLKIPYKQNPNEAIQEQEYQLRSVIVHHGSTPHFGHYFSYEPVLPSLSSTENRCSRWIIHDDDRRVEEVDERTIRDDLETSGYVAFYEKTPPKTT